MVIVEIENNKVLYTTNAEDDFKCNVFSFMWDRHIRKTPSPKFEDIQQLLQKIEDITPDENGEFTIETCMFRRVEI